MAGDLDLKSQENQSYIVLFKTVHIVILPLLAEPDDA